MKTQIKTLGFSLLFGASLLAQEKNHLSPEERIDKHVDRLEKQLDLNQEQKEKIKQESIVLHKQLEANKPSKEEREAHKMERKKHHEQLKAQIAPILNEEQRQKLEDAEAKRKEKRATKEGKEKHQNHKRGHHHEKKQLNTSEMAEKRTKKLDKVVALDEDQKEKIRAIHLKDIEAKKAKNEKFKAERLAKKEKKQELIQKHQLKVKEILTDDQAKKYDKIMEKKQERRKSKREDK